MNDTIYDHYIAIDWSIKNMAIARMTKKSNKITVIDVSSDVADLKAYLKNLKGTKILAMEETTVSQWLYTELKDYVDKLFICDPNRNRLLSEGPKTDKIDARKLVHLLKAGLMKEVYHSTDKFLYIRRLVGGYEDVVMVGVRLKNQRYSLLRACGKKGKESKDITLERKNEQYVINSIQRQIDFCEEEKKGYVEEFRKLAKKYSEIRNQMGLPGIDIINAVKIISRVVSPYRFSNNGRYLSYTGLIKHEKISGRRSYGKKKPRYSRQLKSVYKTATVASIKGSNPMRKYYEYLLTEKGYTEYNARNAVTRRLAIVSLGIFKSGKKYQNPRRSKFKKKERT